LGITPTIVARAMNRQQRLSDQQLDEMVQDVNSQSMSVIMDLLKIDFKGIDRDESRADVYAKGLVAILSELSLLNEMIYSSSSLCNLI
jgi:hypothetical protein